MQGGIEPPPSVCINHCDDEIVLGSPQEMVKCDVSGILKPHATLAAIQISTVVVTCFYQEVHEETVRGREGN